MSSRGLPTPPAAGTSYVISAFILFPLPGVLFLLALAAWLIPTHCNQLKFHLLQEAFLGHLHAQPQEDLVALLLLL